MRQLAGGRLLPCRGPEEGGTSCFTATRKADIFPWALTPVWPWAFKATKCMHTPLTKFRHYLNIYTDAKCPATHSYMFGLSSWLSFSQLQYFSANSSNSDITWSIGFSQKVLSIAHPLLYSLLGSVCSFLSGAFCTALAEGNAQRLLFPATACRCLRQPGRQRQLWCESFYSSSVGVAVKND